MYWIVFLFALVSYRNLRKELDFHFKYGFMLMQTISNLLNVLVVMEAWPWGSFCVAFALLGLVVLVR